jgi:hypothetical protein
LYCNANANRKPLKILDGTNHKVATLRELAIVHENYPDFQGEGIAVARRVEAMLDDSIIDTHSLLSNRAASFNDWRFSKKSLQGSARLSRFAKFPMLKSAGISVVLTSYHSQHAIL